ncbi:MAG: hypothetical protein XU15_C0008G0050 [candidate division NC10 bacterium CSP1-5]|nr:MAG: hypothetical protein XU15_C0008G0050 [candidate division NC10 bacterium CSP1-5]
MQKATLTVFSLLVVFAGVTGCASTAGVVTAKEDGSSQVYQVNSSQAWEITKTVFRWHDSDAIEEHQREGYILATNGKKWVPWASMMVAWVDRVDRNKTKVTVVTKRRIGDVGTGSSEATFHKHFAEALKIVKAGKALPPERPE